MSIITVSKTPNSAALEAGRTYLTVDQTARYLGVSDRTLRAWKARGVGPAHIRLGGIIRFRRDDVDAWAGSRRVA